MGNLGGLVDPYVSGRLRRHEITALTARNDRAILRQFASALGPLPAERLQPRHIHHWLETIEALAPATRRRRFSTVRTFCHHLVTEKRLARDPTVGMHGPRQPRTVPRALAAEVVAATLDACPDARARLIVTLMVQLGLRCCEVAALEQGDVDRARGLVRVRGKGDHERILPLVEEARIVLDEYQRVYPATAGPLVRSHLHPQRGLDPDTISGLVVVWMTAAGVKQKPRDGVSAHALRHTAATDMLRAGAHLRDVQRALGHAHLITTEVYLPYVVRGLERAMAGRQYGQTARAVADVEADELLNPSAS
jgi:site-specific recombinase XerD